MTFDRFLFALAAVAIMLVLVGLVDGFWSMRCVICRAHFAVFRYQRCVKHRVKQ